ncbi:MAG: FAD-dependent oxidoreductase [Spirochaetes bacterium]|nr:FAD-dependent oxidoreductase [Spirochaetota bacterium]
MKGSEHLISADTVIIAVGQYSDISFLPQDINISRVGTVIVDPDTMATNIPGVFAGGDVVTGPNNVTEAIAHGKLAAQMIDKYIRGEKLERKYEVTRPALHVESLQLSDEEIEKLKKPEMSLIPVSQRIESFLEVELGFTEAEAIAEAKRCLRCDLEKKRE